MGIPLSVPGFVGGVFAVGIHQYLTARVNGLAFLVGVLLSLLILPLVRAINAGFNKLAILCVRQEAWYKIIRNEAERQMREERAVEYEAVRIATHQEQQLACDKAQHEAGLSIVHDGNNPVRLASFQPTTEAALGNDDDSITMSSGDSASGPFVEETRFGSAKVPGTPIDALSEAADGHLPSGNDIDGGHKSGKDSDHDLAMGGQNINSTDTDESEHGRQKASKSADMEDKLREKRRAKKQRQKARAEAERLALEEQGKAKARTDKRRLRRQRVKQAQKVLV